MITPRHYYDGLNDEISNKFAISKFGPSKTDQNQMASCDINNILKKYAKTGLLPDLIKSNPMYGDFTNTMDYHQSLDFVLHAQAQFEALPALVRARFDHDPANFLEFANDPKNLDEMVEMGLATRKKIVADATPQNTAGSVSDAPAPAVGEGPKT